MRPPAGHRPRPPSEFFTRAKSNSLWRGASRLRDDGPEMAGYVGVGRRSASPDRATRGLNGGLEDADDSVGEASPSPVLGRRLPWVGHFEAPLRIEGINSDKPLTNRRFKFCDEWRSGPTFLAPGFVISASRSVEAPERPPVFSPTRSAASQRFWSIRLPYRSIVISAEAWPRMR